MSNVIDLNNISTPHVDVKIGSKTYTVYANDSNVNALANLMALGESHFSKMGELSDRALKDDPKGTAKGVVKVMTDIAETIKAAVDEIVGDKGAGQKLYDQSHGSTEYVMYGITRIQSALSQEQANHKALVDKEVTASFPKTKAKKIAKHA